MPRAAVNRVVEAIRSATGDLGHGRIGLTFNILIGGPGTTSQDALDDALRTARFALETARDANVSVDLNLHPYYRGARGQASFPAHPRCSLETTARVASAIAELTASCIPPSVLFIGSNDEGHDRDLIPPGWRADTVREAFDEFNRSQDPSTLWNSHADGNMDKS